MTDEIKGSCMRVCPPMKNEIERLNAEIERLKVENERLITMHNEMCLGTKKLKEFAVKEFAERLKKKYENHIVCSFNVLNNEIDDLLAEMTEPTKLEHSSLCETETYER